MSPGEDKSIRLLAEAVARQRGYADFFHWPYKRQKELGLLQTFVDAAKVIGFEITDFRLADEGADPPDAWADHEGGVVAIELTEFVDQSRVEVQRRAAVAWRSWSVEEVRAKLAAIVAQKDHAGFGSDIPYWLVVHCDEPSISGQTLAEYLRSFGPLRVQGISRCFVLLSYAPTVKGYPLFEVSVESSA